MGDTKYVPNDAGIRALLQSPEIQSLTEDYARGRAGADGELKSFIGFDRAKTIIYSAGKER